MTSEEYVDMLLKYRPSKLLSEGVQANLYVEMYLSDKDRTVTELSNLLNVSTARMAVLINSLEKDGKVVRVKSNEDKRITIVHLTEKGLNDISCAKNFLIKKVDVSIKALGAQEFDRFIKDLMVLVNLGGSEEC